MSRERLSMQSAAGFWMARGMRDSIYKMIADVVEMQVDTFIGDDQEPEEWDLSGLNETLLPIIPFEPITQNAWNVKIKRN